MPRRVGETNAQWMQRLQDYRADELMQRTRAAVGFLNSGPGTGSQRSKMNAFLALFHPEIEPHSPEWMELMRSADQ